MSGLGLTRRRLGGGGGDGAALIIGGAVTPGSKTVVRVDAAGNTLSGAEYNPGAAYYAAHPCWQFTDQTIDGQAMIRIPQVWYRRGVISGGDNDGKQAWWISNRPVPGFVLHPAFHDAGDEIKQFWIGKYQGSNDGGTKVASVPGVTPLVSINIGVYQTRCAARNAGGVTGFMLWSIYQLAVVQMLAMIETGSTDSQAAIGNGRISESSAANVDAEDVAQASYRGLVGLWGNVWQFLDGWRCNAGVMELWDRVGNRGWVSTGITRLTAGGSGPLTMLSAAGAGYDFRDVFVCDVKAANSAASTWPDYVYLLDTDNRIARHGGSWDSGAIAGLWALNGNLGPTYSSTSYGGRLAKV